MNEFRFANWRGKDDELPPILWGESLMAHVVRTAYKPSPIGASVPRRVPAQLSKKPRK